MNENRPQMVVMVDPVNEYIEVEDTLQGRTIVDEMIDEIVKGLVRFDERSRRA